MGMQFDSIGEKNRFLILQDMQKSGEISNLQRQVKFDLCVNNQKICTYIADFTYVKNGEEIVEDFKGYITPEFRLKQKLFKAVFGKGILLSNKA